MLTAVILAAGQSRRMGTPKALLTLRGKTFVEHLIRATRHPRVGITRVVLGAGAEEIRAKLPAIRPASIIVNPGWRTGQLSSIQAAIRALSAQETEGMILCPVDHPLIPAKLVAQLIAAFESTGKKIVLPVFHGRRGHPVIFRASLFSELLAASPEIGARQVVWAHADDVAEIPTEEQAVILNLNDPRTLNQAIQKL